MVISHNVIVAGDDGAKNDLHNIEQLPIVWYMTLATLCCRKTVFDYIIFGAFSYMMAVIWLFSIFYICLRVVYIVCAVISYDIEIVDFLGMRAEKFKIISLYSVRKAVFEVNWIAVE